MTFTKDVAPIFQQKCQVCHQPNSIGPMSLITYEDARKFATRIKASVRARVMPPWHIDKTVGIREFKNDRSLTDGEIETIVGWVDGGALPGDPKDMPPPVQFPDPTGWQLAKQFGPPDLVIKSPPYTLAPRTQDKWFRPMTDTGLTEPRWVRAIEIKPSYPDGRRIVHHVLTTLQQAEEGITGLAHSAHDVQTNAGLFMEWAVGKVGEVFAADAGKLMLPGSQIRWEIHMFAIGEEIKDNQVELGIYFYPKGRRAEAPHGAADVRRQPRIGARHPARRSGDDAELLRHAGAGADREFPAAHAHARQGDVASRPSIPTAGRKC